MNNDLLSDREIENLVRQFEATGNRNFLDSANLAREQRGLRKNFSGSKASAELQVQKLSRDERQKLVKAAQLRSAGNFQIQIQRSKEYAK